MAHHDKSTMNSTNKSGKWLGILPFVTFCIGIFLGLYIPTLISPSFVKNNDIRADRRGQGTKYTSPLLDCAESDSLSITELKIMESRLEQYVVDNRASVDMAIYFRDLNNGGWIQTGQSDVFQPASLMKLPVMIAAYKKLESDSTFFDQKVTVTTETEPTQHIISGPKTMQNDSLSVRELLYRAMVYSDNRANDSLLYEVGMPLVEEILKDYGLPPLTSPADYHVTPRIYSSFLRILYNATYLSIANSEDALKHLADSSFDKGLRLGIPKEVMVAHKFGERVINEKGIGRKYQLHDCGIVYTKKPYILCVMTRGDSFDDLYKSIGDVSRTVYQLMSAE